MSDPSGAPARADVVVAYEMIGMEHGVVSQRANAGAAGHYVIPLNFAMGGSWRLQIRVTTAAGASSLLVMIPELDR